MNQSNPYCQDCRHKINPCDTCFYRDKTLKEIDKNVSNGSNRKDKN